MKRLSIFNLFHKRPNWPRNIHEAVSKLKDTIPMDQLDLIMGQESFEYSDFHFGLGQYIRNNFGLWQGNNSLLLDCNTNDADIASGVIAKNLWKDLVNTASSADIERASKAWHAYQENEERILQEYMDKEAESDAKITDRSCPQCGKPCPEYRLTCKHCKYRIGRTL